MPKRFHLLPALLFCVALSNVADAQGKPPPRWTAKNHLPQMTCVASPPIFAQVSSTIVYVLTQTDYDTWTDNTTGLDVQLIDTTCKIKPFKVTSMVAGYSFSPRGVTGAPTPGAIPWDIVGTTVATPGTYHDTWTAYNDGLPGDVTIDQEITAIQTVILVGPVPLPSTPVPTPTMPKPAPTTPTP